MTSDKQKIIVTGGLGYIGSHTVVELWNAGYEAIIADNLSNSSTSVLDGLKKITGHRFTFHQVELTKEFECDQFFNLHSDAVGVIHFAALKSVGESVLKPLLYYKNNLGSMINVLTAMKKHQIPKIIFSSSCTVYGQADVLPVTELTPFKKAASPYGDTKQMCENILMNLAQDPHNNISMVSLRYFNPIGAHPSAHIGEAPQGIPNNLLPYITQTAAGIRESLQVFGNDYNTPDGTPIRDYIHVVDIANAHVKALSFANSMTPPTMFEAFNLGTGRGHSVLEVIRSFEKVSDASLPYHFTDRRPGDIECIYADTTKANQILKWQTQFDLDDMTASAWNWEQSLQT